VDLEEGNTVKDRDKLKAVVSEPTLTCSQPNTSNNSRNIVSLEVNGFTHLTPADLEHSLILKQFGNVI